MVPVHENRLRDGAPRENVYITPDDGIEDMMEKGDLHCVMERVANLIMSALEEGGGGPARSDDSGDWIEVLPPKRRAYPVVRSECVAMHLDIKRAVDVRMLVLKRQITDWKSQVIPPSDGMGPIDTPSIRVCVFNSNILKNKDMLAMTMQDEEISPIPADLPPGVTLFNPIEDPNRVLAFNELRSLFSGRRNQLRGPDILYLAKKPAAAKYMNLVLDDLHQRKLHNLLLFIKTHLKAIQSTIGATDNDMDSCSLTFVKYSVGQGLIAHIDGIQDFNSTFGPIFTINMGEGEKLLDLLPVATADDDESPPVRIFTQQYDITMLQGCARAGYAHSIPFGNPKEMYTIAIKFPAIESAVLDGEYHSEKFGATVPIIKLRHA